MALWNLFVTASIPILNVLLLIVVGSISATSRIGILGQDAMKILNNVVFYIFNPALVSSSLSQTITMESMVLLWFMPVNLFLNFILGSALGWIVIQTTKAPAQLSGVILASCSAGNVGNLLLILVPAICKQKAIPFGGSDVCDTYGLTYASLSLAIGTILQWSYVYNIVRISISPKEDKVRDNLPTTKFPQETRRSLPQRHTVEEVSTINYLISSSSSNEFAPSLSRYEVSYDKVPTLVKARHILGKLLETIDFKKLFAPATIGVIVGFIIGAIPQIKKAMVGESAPLRIIHDSATLLGNGTIPSLILLTGGNLIKGLHGSGVKFSLILGVIVVRYIALPLLGTAIVQWGIHMGLVHSDPLYHFILLMQHAVPPAMNIASMIQMFEAGEGELSVIFLWTYVVASVALTLWSTLFLWLVS